MFQWFFHFNKSLIIYWCSLLLPQQVVCAASIGWLLRSFGPVEDPCVSQGGGGPWCLKRWNRQSLSIHWYFVSLLGQRIVGWKRLSRFPLLPCMCWEAIWRFALLVAQPPAWLIDWSWMVDLRLNFFCKEMMCTNAALASRRTTIRSYLKTWKNIKSSLTGGSKWTKRRASCPVMCLFCFNHSVQSSWQSETLHLFFLRLFAAKVPSTRPERDTCTSNSRGLLWNLLRAEKSRDAAHGPITSFFRASTRLCTGFPSLVHWICFGVGNEVIQMNIVWQVRYFVCKEGVGVKAGDRLWPARRRLQKTARLALCLAALVACGRRDAFFFADYFCMACAVLSAYWRDATDCLRWRLLLDAFCVAGVVRPSTSCYFVHFPSSPHPPP